MKSQSIVNTPIYIPTSCLFLLNTIYLVLTYDKELVLVIIINTDSASILT